MTILYCCLNRSKKINKNPLEYIYLVEFVENNGFWSKRYAAVDAADAKSKLLEEHPNAIYKRSKRSK